MATKRTQSAAFSKIRLGPGAEFDVFPEFLDAAEIQALKLEVESIAVDERPRAEKLLGLPEGRVFARKPYSIMGNPVLRGASSIAFKTAEAPAYEYNGGVDPTFDVSKMPVIQRLMAKVSTHTDIQCNLCLVNLMRESEERGSNELGMHRDDEKSFDDPLVAAVVLNDPARPVRLLFAPKRGQSQEPPTDWPMRKKRRTKKNPNPQTVPAAIDILIPNGAMYTMRGENFQARFKHGVPAASGTRYSFTFRRLM